MKRWLSHVWRTWRRKPTRQEAHDALDQPGKDKL